MRIRAGRSKGDRGERGAELIEFAIVFPILLLVIAAIVDFGLMFQHYEVVTNAAREGARIAVLPNYTTADVEARVSNYLAASGLTSTPTTTVTPTTITLSTGATIAGIQVVVQYPHAFAILAPVSALFGGGVGTITLGAESTMRVEVPAG